MNESHSSRTASLFETTKCKKRRRGITCGENSFETARVVLSLCNSFWGGWLSCMILLWSNLLIFYLWNEKGLQWDHFETLIYLIRGWRTLGSKTGLLPQPLEGCGRQRKGGAAGVGSDARAEVRAEMQRRSPWTRSWPHAKASCLLLVPTPRVAWEGRRAPAAKAEKKCQCVRGCGRNHMGPSNTEKH